MRRVPEAPAPRPRRASRVRPRSRSRSSSSGRGALAQGLRARGARRAGREGTRADDRLRPRAVRERLARAATAATRATGSSRATCGARSARRARPSGLLADPYTATSIRFVRGGASEVRHRPRRRARRRVAEGRAAVDVRRARALRQRPAEPARRRRIGRPSEGRRRRGDRGFAPDTSFRCADRSPIAVERRCRAVGVTRRRAHAMQRGSTRVRGLGRPPSTGVRVRLVDARPACARRRVRAARSSGACARQRDAAGSPAERLCGAADRGDAATRASTATRRRRVRVSLAATDPPAPRWRRKRWNSRASTSPEGRSRRVRPALLVVGGALEALDEGLDVGVRSATARETWRSYSPAASSSSGRVDRDADEALELAQRARARPSGSAPTAT